MAFLTTKLTLAKEPKPIQTRTGTPMATAFGFAKLGNDSPDLPLAVTAFGNVAELLLQHDKGQVIQISGDLKIHTYMNREQQEVEQLQITVDMLASAKQTKPARRGDSQRQGNQNHQQGYGQQQPMQSPPANQPNQYQNDMGFQQRPNKPAPQMGQPMGADQFADDDINF
jgi:single-stranded DNA-binding protein